MEKKKTLGFSFAFQQVLVLFLTDVFLLGSGSVTTEDLRTWRAIALQQVTFLPRQTFPSFILWLEWFFYDQFVSVFYSTRGLLRLGTPIFVATCVSVWRYLFAYIGNRGLVGWRRVALKGFITKQRFVTRYNYRRLAHYFWRRNQRRWRLFKTRRRPFFFLRRYRKFRRLRYHLALNLSWRSTQKLQRLDTRWGGTRTRLFVREFLRWRAYLLAKRLSFGGTFRVRLLRQIPCFALYRYQARYRGVRAVPFFGQVVSQTRLWRHRRTGLVGIRPFSPRSLRRSWSRGTQFRRFLSESSRLRRRSWFWRVQYFGRLHRRHLCLPRLRRLRKMLVVFPRKLRRKARRSRWYPPRVWRRRVRRYRFIRSLLRPYVRRRFSMFRGFRYRKGRRRARRRIKRRLKRRKKYWRRWRRRFIYSTRRRRIRALRKCSYPRRLRKARRLRRRARYIGSFLSIPKLRHGITSIQKVRLQQFGLLSDASVFPLVQVRALQSCWRGGVGTTDRFTTIKLYQRQLRARHAGWTDGERPVYQRLLHFRRWRRNSNFGRYRRWLCSLFINGSRHFFYRERTFPIVHSIIPRQLGFAPGQAMANIRFIRVAGASLRTRRQRLYRRRFFQKLRARSRVRVRGRGRFMRRRWQSGFLRLLRKVRLRRKRFWFARQKMSQKRNRLRTICRFRFRSRLGRSIRRGVFSRRFFVAARWRVRFWLHRKIWWWNYRVRLLRYSSRRRLVRRNAEMMMGRLMLSFLRFRLRYLQVRRPVTRVRVQQRRFVRLLRQGLKKQVRFFIRARRLRRFAALVRRRFRRCFFQQVQLRLRQVNSGGMDIPLPAAPFFLLSRKVENFRNRIRSLAPRRAVFGMKKNVFMRQRSLGYRASRYIIRRGAGLFKAHALLTRRYPSVYDFETFNYLFSSDFLYTRFTQQGNRLRSQLIVMSVLRYLRPYSSFHLVRFIERFLVEGFPIYFEMSSLKQSNKEQPFPVPINLSFFRTYMLKAIATRFRAKRQAVSFQAALLVELWSWHVDPTQSILHDFLVNHYAVGLDSRFFVHYRWRVKR